MQQASLFDTLRAPATIIPCNPDGNVLQGDADETLRMERKDYAIPFVVIDLHQVRDGKHKGKWMWGIAINRKNSSGCSYKVGEKWGKFAENRDDALFYAREEVTQRYQQEQGCPEWPQVKAWLSNLLL